jgi:short subunit dehydrogenase-like uncharacterized protein
MKTVVVFGATGFTGKLVVSALRDLGVRNLVLGGRSEEKLKELSRRSGDLEIRLADATRPETLGPLCRGAHVVIDTAGPFLIYGEPVVRAALAAGAHFLDTTGEQAYMARILERYHGSAKDKQRVVVNAQAFEFALGYVAAALLADRHPDSTTIDVFNRVAGFGATRGTQKSGLAAITEAALIRRHGRLIRRGSSPLPLWVKMPDSDKKEPAVPFPGGEALHLARAYPSVRNVTTNLVVPIQLAAPMMAAWSARSVLRLLDKAGAFEPLRRRIDAGPEGPTDEARDKQSFKVLARGEGPGGRHGVLIQGKDPYGITGVIAALGAKMLIDGEPLTTGVVSTDQAFGARQFLDALEPAGVSVSEHLLD